MEKIIIKQNMSEFEERDSAIFNLPSAAPLAGDYEYAQTRFRGYSEEILKLTDFLDTKSQRYELLDLGEGIAEVRLTGEKLTPDLIRNYPALKATGLRENFRRGIVEVWFSDTGFSVISDCEQSEYFDGEHEGGMGRWAWEYDMMDRIAGNFIYMKTGDKIEVYYTYPGVLKEKWNKNNYLLNIDGKLYGKKVAEDNQFVIEKGVITKYLGIGGTVVIPEGIITIGSGVFRDNKTIREVIFPETMKSIPDFCFRGCTGLQRVVFPEGIETIEEYAFCGCSSLTEIVFPHSLREIGRSAFGDCSRLEAVVFQDGLKIIGNHSFSGCRNIKNISFPETLCEIGVMAFYECNIDYSTLHLPASLISVGGGIENWKNIPNIIYNEGKTSILYYSPDNIEEVFVLPESIQYINRDAFFNNKHIKKIVLPDALKTIGLNAFNGCSKLETVIIPDNVSNIGYSAFSGCNLKKIQIPESISFIEERAFANNRNLTEVTFPVDLKTIGKEAFSSCDSLTEIQFPADGKLEAIGPSAFMGCQKLAKVMLPERLKTIMQEAFANCISLESICLPNSLRSIETKAFTNSGLRQLSIPGNVKEVSVAIAEKCNELKNVVINDGIQKIGGRAFASCPVLTEVYIRGNLKKKHGTKVFNKSPNVTVYGIPGTLAEELACENGVQFVPINETE